MATDKIKTIRGHVEVHTETRWSDRSGEDGVKELTVDSWRVQHRDGSVEFTSTAQEALRKIAAFDQGARRQAERKNPRARP